MSELSIRLTRGRVTVLATLAIALFSAGAMAQPKPGQRGGPPAQALTACEALKSGNACSFTGRRGAVEGTCEAPQGKPLACRPANAPGPDGENGRPPRK